MLGLLFITILHYPRADCRTGWNIIWDKNRQAFVQLYDVPRFGQDPAARPLFGEPDSWVENDLNGQTLTAAYYEERSFVMFYDNDTKVTGICGDIWNLLAYHRNFTLMPMKSKERNFGERLKNGSYSGLMGVLHRNETEVILRTGYYSFRSNLFDYTMPIWKTRYRLYIQPKYEYDDQWLITMFTRQTWIVILFIFLALSIVGYLLQTERYEGRKRGWKLKKSTSERYTFNDHIFFTYSMMCGQGYLPDTFRSQNKILTISKTIFAWLILLTFSSTLIYRMTNRTIIPPFTNLDTMLNKTRYDLLVFRGSTVYELVKDRIQYSSARRYYAPSQRIHFVKDPRIMYEQVCGDGKLFAMLETHDKAVSRGIGFCSITPIGESYFQSWIGFGVSKHFPYKRTIDQSIMKLHEVGMVDVLKKRWLKQYLDNKEQNPFKKIDMVQVHLIFLLFLIGTVTSLLIFSAENVVFLCGWDRSK